MLGREEEIEIMCGEVGGADENVVDDNVSGGVHEVGLDYLGLVGSNGLGSGLKILLEAQKDVLCPGDVVKTNSPLRLGFTNSVSINSPQQSLPNVGPTSSSFLSETNIGEEQVSGTPSNGFIDGGPTIIASEGVARTPVFRRRRRGIRRIRGGFGRGVQAQNLFSSSGRFLNYARDIGKRPRHVGVSSVPDGLELHVELPNINSIPTEHEGSLDLILGSQLNRHVGIDEVVGTTVVGSAGELPSANISGPSRLLEIGRRIGVTFRCGEDTMIEKLVQLEERDKKEKEERGMRNTGYQ